MEPEIEARFLDWPAREIPLLDIRDWYFAAAGEPFPRPTMRWILPRLMELLGEGWCLASVGNEAVLLRLRASGFPGEWPEGAVRLVTAWAAALAEAVVAAPEALRQEGNLPLLDETLCMLGMGGIDLGPALARLDALPTATLVATFERDVEWVFDRVPVNSFWESGPGKEAVLGWYTSDAMLDRMLRHGAGDGADAPGATVALHVAEAILQYREWVP